ncbi:hypothetical protein [Algicella marina]|uniref:Uncharacterized protein n=1 Tax=Algicella marina TaxID=2683284 RepID=A0A6P1SWU9_9RHOB|nr:hypothetical protein [Algicella marina]QHQ33961.1 hypothetical protein GO499_01570 [Algicella marina]
MRAVLIVVAAAGLLAHTAAALAAGAEVCTADENNRFTAECLRLAQETSYARGYTDACSHAKGTIAIREGALRRCYPAYGGNPNFSLFSDTGPAGSYLYVPPELELYSQ